MPSLRRISTQVPGLDEILHGGLFEGGVYIVEGPPGVGKTTLANQLAYLRAAEGQKTIYVTMLAESHARLLQHMAGQSFFRSASVNREVIYISAYRELERNGLKGVLGLLREEVTRHQANMLVVDGVVVPGDGSPLDEQVRQFVHELQSLGGMLGCMSLLLTSGTGRSINAEQTMVDGIFRLEDHPHRWRAERRFHVRKFRGSAVERGGHTFCISDDGLRFYPRLETMPLPEPATPEDARGVLSSGIASLDAHIQIGGLREGSCTAVYGPSGTGKTLTAMAFAALASAAEPGLVLGFDERAAELTTVCHSFGIALDLQGQGGPLGFVWYGAQDVALDEIGHHLLEHVDRGGVRRLVVDGLAGLADTPAFEERGYRFLGQLLAQLRARRVTSLFTLDPHAFGAAGGGIDSRGLLTWFDNLLELQMPPDGEDFRVAFLRKLRGTRARQAQARLHLGARGPTLQ
jgi:circadian clock protein KaiC